MKYYYYKTPNGKAYAKLKKPADPNWGYVPATEAEFEAAKSLAEAEMAAWKASH